MKQSPLVSIIILNYNGGKFVEKCLSSVMKLEYPNYEVLFVDNASTDGSVSEVKKNFPEISTVENPTNLGFTGGMNIGLEHAHGDMIAFLNIDAEVHPYWLKELVLEAQKDHTVGACAGKVCGFINGKLHVGSHDGLRVNKNLANYDCLQEVSTVCGSAFLVKRSVIDVVGILDEKFFMYFDEVDWCWRMRIAGYKCMYVPNAIAFHKGGGSGMPSQRRIYLSTKNWIRSILKNCELETLPLFLSFVFLKFVLALFQSFSLKESTRTEGRMRLLLYSKACLKNLTGLKDIIYEREKVQKLRKVSDLSLHLFNCTLSFAYITIDRSLLP
jgi:GT2 family glycosyltransferase